MDNLSFSQARKMVGDAYCCLKRIISTKHIPLPVRYIGNPNKGIKELLDATRNKYSTRHNGVIIAYGSIQRLQSVANIVEEQPVLHFDIKGEFIIFQPSVGDIVKATVNKRGKDFVGCVVHGCFNAAMPLLQQESCLELGEEFLMEVTSLHIHNQLLSMKGRLHQRLCESLPSCSMIDTTGVIPDSDSFEGSKKSARKRKHSGHSVDPENQLSASSPKRKKQKSDSHHGNVYEACEKADSLQADSEPRSRTKKKKKKRKKRDSLSSDSGILGDNHCDEYTSTLDNSLNYASHELCSGVLHGHLTKDNKDESNVYQIGEPGTSRLSDSCFLSPDLNSNKHKKKKRKKHSVCSV